MSSHVFLLLCKSAAITAMERGVPTALHTRALFAALSVQPKPARRVCMRSRFGWCVVGEIQIRGMAGSLFLQLYIHCFWPGFPSNCTTLAALKVQIDTAADHAVAASRVNAHLKSARLFAFGHNCLRGRMSVLGSVMHVQSRASEKMVAAMRECTYEIPCSALFYRVLVVTTEWNLAQCAFPTLSSLHYNRETASAPHRPSSPQMASVCFHLFQMFP